MWPPAPVKWCPASVKPSVPVTNVGRTYVAWGSRREAIAHAPDGLYPARLARIVFNHAPQAQHRDVDGAIIANAFFIVAGQGKQSLSGKGFARIADQSFQKIGFPASKPDVFTVT